MADYTTTLMRDLDNPSKFEVMRSVPVFMAHEREFPEQKLPDGRVIPARKVVVREHHLREMANNLNREIARTGQLRPLTIGHRNMHPDHPESRQPQLVGFAKGYRVETVQRPDGSFLALVEDEYILREHAGCLKQYPYRSIDYDPDRRMSEGTALLIRTPWLKMGTTITYQADHGHHRGTTMPAHQTATTNDQMKAIVSYASRHGIDSYEQARDEWREVHGLPPVSYAEATVHRLGGPDPGRIPEVHREAMTAAEAEIAKAEKLSRETDEYYAKIKAKTLAFAEQMQREGRKDHHFNEKNNYGETVTTLKSDDTDEIVSYASRFGLDYDTAAARYRDSKAKGLNPHTQELLRN